MRTQLLIAVALGLLGGLLAPGGGNLTRLPATATPQPDFAQFGYTHILPDGNRLIAGNGAINPAAWLDIPLDGTPVWLVAVPDGAANLWAAVLADGRVQAFRVEAAGWQAIPIAPEQRHPSAPPLLAFDGNQLQMLTAPSEPAAPLTHPIIVQGKLIFIDAAGNLQVGNALLPVNALPDARLVQDENGRVLVLSHPSGEYAHGVLGDALEATQITVVETVPKPHIASVIDMPPGKVIEGLAPIWADINGDGEREIIVTLSDAASGAQLVVFAENGEQIALSEPIGQGYRWRHQIAVAAFGPQHESELATVLTPHLGGVVEFFRISGDQLVRVAQLPGYTSHVINTRNLDMALAGDFDGNGQPELLLPTQARTALGAIQRDENGASLLWSLPLPGVLSTNLAATTSAEGQTWLGAGLENGQLRIWLPEQ